MSKYFVVEYGTTGKIGTRISSLEEVNNPKTHWNLLDAKVEEAESAEAAYQRANHFMQGMCHGPMILRITEADSKGTRTGTPRYFVFR